MAEVELSAVRALGAALRQHRMSKGMSLRALARNVGLSAHGTLVDYEHGRRIPPEDLLVACEKVLDLFADVAGGAGLVLTCERHGSPSVTMSSTVNPAVIT
ncbi:multiprotein-bridging factor 1 family protein, partial [Kibdelosporangium lantanae]